MDAIILTYGKDERLMDGSDLQKIVELINRKLYP